MNEQHRAETNRTRSTEQRRPSILLNSVLLNEQHRAETRGKERERRWTEQHDVVSAQHGARDERHGASNEQQRKRDTCIAQTQRATAVEQERGSLAWLCEYFPLGRTPTASHGR